MKQTKIDNILKILVVMLAFVIPISTSLSSIVLVLFLICWPLAGNLKTRLMQIMTPPIAHATLLFFGLCIIGTLYAGYTGDYIPWQDRVHSLGKEAKFLVILLCLPVLQNPKIRQYAFWSFIAAVSLTLLLGYIRHYTSISIPGSSRFASPYVFRDSVHTSFILSFTLYISAHYLITRQHRDNLPRMAQLLLYAVIASSIIFLFFMGHGRAGYFIFIALSILLTIQLYQQNQIRVKSILFSISLLITLIVSANVYSPKFQSRVAAIKTNILQYQAGDTATSLGCRLEFIKNSLVLIQAHPIIGYGTGSFKSVYKNFAETHQQQVSDNPHNEYLRLVFQLGFMGCLFLAYWLLVALKERHKLPQFEKNCAEGMLLAMGIGCLANSWITDFTSGYLFVYWMAFAFSAGFPQKRPEKLSIIVTTYNWPEALRTVLESLIAQKSPIPYEIIIADDGSREETSVLIKSYQEKCLLQMKQDNAVSIKHIWHKDEGFRAAAIRNKAIAAASGDYIIFLDGDSVPRANFLKRQINLAENGYFVVGNRILLSKLFTEVVLATQSPIHTWPLSKWLSLRLQGSCNRLSSLFSIPLGLFRFTKTTHWKGAKGCNLAVWKADLFKVNGWDEQFSGWGYEDSDLVIRLIRAAVKRKEGRYLVPIIHLWHKENDRSFEPQNWSKLQESFTNSSFLANIGLKENNGIS